MVRAKIRLGGSPLSTVTSFGEKRVEKDQVRENLSFEKDESYQEELKNYPLYGAGHQEELDRQNLYEVAKNSLCVWYSPWQHQNEDNPIIPLLQEIKHHFKERLSSKDVTGLMKSAVLGGITLLERATDTYLSFQMNKNINLARGTFDAVRQAAENKNNRLIQAGDGQRFHLLFDEAVQTTLDNIYWVDNVPNPVKNGLHPHARLIIFIDDLDRCEEAVIVNLLESIKLYLNSQRCVFVFGMDDSAVTSALERYWPGRSEDSCRDYLEKLFQATIQVPLPQGNKILAHIERQLKAHQIDQPKCAAMIEQLLEPNPRKIKNFLNSLCASWNLLKIRPKQQDIQSDGQEIEPNKQEAERKLLEQFILTLYLRLFHRSIWRLLERQPWAVASLYKVLTGTQPAGVPGGMDVDSQRMMEEVFSRAFLHVLMDNTKDFSSGNDAKHRNLSLDDAVTMIQQRLDRKRSDEHFIKFFKESFAEVTKIDSRFLHLDLPTPSE